MTKKDLEAEVLRLRTFIDEIESIAKLAKRYNHIGPGYVEEILERIAAEKNPDGGVD